jgi:hypothetical protein
VEGVSSKKGWIFQSGMMLIELSGISFREGWIDIASKGEVMVRRGKKNCSKRRDSELEQAQKY